MPLKKEPRDAVHSLPELFAVAFAMEMEAASRYDDLAVKMREHGSQDTAAIFEYLAQQERKHRDDVGEWSQRTIGMLPKSAEVRWDLSDTFDNEAAAEMAGSHLATPYRALSLAVRNEERTFAFWTYVAAQADDAAIRHVAEQMAREELEHVASLRRERRRAYHAFYASVGKTPPRLTSARNALMAAVDLETRFTNQLRSDTVTPAGARARQQELIAESQRMAEAAAVFVGGSAIKSAQPEQATGVPDLVATAERLVECYLEAAEHAKDEATLSQTQSFARNAIRRLAWLREMSKGVVSSGPADNRDYTPAQWPG